MKRIKSLNTLTVTLKSYKSSEGNWFFFFFVIVSDKEEDEVGIRCLLGKG